MLRIDGLDIIENCPHCENHVSPTLIERGGFYDESMNFDMETYILKCNRYNCGRYYMIDVWLGNTYGTYGKSQVVDSIKYPNFPTDLKDEIINNISPDFIEIYNESIAAESAKLLKICGGGFRKAIEFLIKDYIIYLNKKDETFDVKNIKSSVKIMKLISTYINDVQIKAVAEKIFWIGNDEVHYERKWKSKDIQDMKNLIEILTYKIKMEASYEKYMLEMES